MTSSSRAEPEDPMAKEDSVLRAITDDGAFRVITAVTTRTVRGAVEVQGVDGNTAKHFGDLLTGVIRRIDPL